MVLECALPEPNVDSSSEFHGQAKWQRLDATL